MKIFDKEIITEKDRVESNRFIFKSGIVIGIIITLIAMIIS